MTYRLPVLHHKASKADSDAWTEFSSFDDSPYPVGMRSSLAKMPSQFSLSPDPLQWGFEISLDSVESDDELYTAEESRLSVTKRTKNSISSRGLLNCGCLITLCVGLLVLFIGYPVITFYGQTPLLTGGGFNLGGTNSSGQVPLLVGNFGLIDNDTPKEAYVKPSWAEPPNEMQLVFSDEFNTDGRTFYPGDDPYWEAVDLHYWATNNLEWNDPEAVTTSNGSLVITLSQKETHGLNYEGGMVSTWNKFCFTGGYVETSVVLPGVNSVLGLWPAIWTLGNLGRAGYGASLEGMWPYSYDTCDIGTVANQTINGQPIAATVGGDRSKGGVLSYLPGQRLSRCTCPGESHPGPKHNDGSFVGRSAPEIDMFEAQIDQHTLIPGVSQSSQWAPFNAGYVWANSSDNLIIPDPLVSKLNTYIGSATQQATSVVTNTNVTGYELDGASFQIYGFEYKPGFDEGYITWISSNMHAWTLNAAGMGPDANVNISARPVPQEPMYLIANLGMSRNFGPVDLDHLPFPVHMYVDYIRVYQRKDQINIGCNPKDFPTTDYINTYIEAYTNPNLTTWVDDYNQTFPKNSWLHQC